MTGLVCKEDKHSKVAINRPVTKPIHTNHTTLYPTPLYTLNPMRKYNFLVKKNIFFEYKKPL